MRLLFVSLYDLSIMILKKKNRISILSIYYREKKIEVVTDTDLNSLLLPVQVIREKLTFKSAEI